jgi:hypothetical protein
MHSKHEPVHKSMLEKRPTPTPGVKTFALIQRKETTTRDEMIAHWYANHMPNVIERNENAKAAGEPNAWRYEASLFEPNDASRQKWDGMAALWYASSPQIPSELRGLNPTDTFQQKVEPYRIFATEEFVFVDGNLPTSPLTLNKPFPTTRSGFLKQISFVQPKPGIDLQTFRDHWLDIHGPNVRDTMKLAGGFRYSVSLALNPEGAPCFGIPELYFPNRESQDHFWKILKTDGFHEMSDQKETVRYRCLTEMVGIPG